MTSSQSPFPGRSLPDFAEKCCAHFGVPRERYVAVLLEHTLYPHARWLRPMLLIFAPDFFAADRDFLFGVGQLWRRRDFQVEVQDFHHHPANRGFLRQGLRLRISVGRVQELVNATLADSPRDANALPELQNFHSTPANAPKPSAG